VFELSFTEEGSGWAALTAQLNEEKGLKTPAEPAAKHSDGETSAAAAKPSKDVAEHGDLG